MALLARIPFVSFTAIAGLVLGSMGVRPAFAQSGLEYEVKAAYLYNFIQFVTWPVDVADASEPFRVCVYGDDPFGPALERMLNGERPEGRAITLDHIRVGASVSACNVLFFPHSQAARALAVLRSVGDAPILTVGESPDFLRSGGMINLFVEGGRVRFDVDVAAAGARGLVMSSKLLRVARHISGGEDR